MFLASLCYLFYKLEHIHKTVGFELVFEKINSDYFLTAFILVIVNWGVEAIKWKYLIRKTEKISFLTSLKSVLSGVSLSIFTPNRIGEFAGKVFYLRSEEKVKATLISFTGSIIQLLITLLTGITAWYLYYTKLQHPAGLDLFFDRNTLLGFIIIMLLLTISGILVLKKSTLKEKIEHYSIREFLNIFLLSAFRYAVFSFQYYCILLVFDIDLGATTSFILIALSFFISTIVPTFAITEIAVRSAASVFVFAGVCPDTHSIILASILLWIINIAIPALIGSLFIWKLNFFNH